MQNNLTKNDSDVESDENPSKAIWKRETTTRVWEVYISGVLDNHGDHLERIDLIRAAFPGDTVRLHLNTPGGRVSVLESYLDAISESEAKIITRAVGMLASAGTDLWLAGDEREISNNASFMFHNTQDYTGGDLYNMNTRIDFMSRFYKDQLTETYGEVLTEDELNTIFTGGEVYIRGTEMQRRLDGKPEETLLSTGLAFPSEQEKTVVIQLQTGFRKEIKLPGISTKDFAEFSVAELKGILQDMGVSPDHFLGERKWDVLARCAVSAVFKAFNQGG
jgi:ATP-dependent protease ClpP protease subunit